MLLRGLKGGEGVRRGTTRLGCCFDKHTSGVRRLWWIVEGMAARRVSAGEGGLLATALPNFLKAPSCLHSHLSSHSHPLP